MPPIIRLWLIVASLLGSLILILEWLPVPSGRFALTLSVSAGLLLIMRRWWYKTVRAPLQPLSRILSEIETGGSGAAPVGSGRDEVSDLAGLVHRVCSELHAGRETGRGSNRNSAAVSPCRRLSGNLGLAADHVESIRALLEISRAHEQPIPRAAFQNLELVSKNLREIQRQLDADTHPEHPACTFQPR